MNRALAQALLFLVLAAPASCTQRTPNPGDRAREGTPGETVKNPPIQEVLARQTPSLMSIKGVTGTGEGEADGKPVIVVYTSHIAREDLIAIPATIEGYKVEVREVGDVTAPPR